MASYTMPLRDYIEMWSQDDESKTFDEKVEIGRKKLFDFNYPTLNDTFKKTFETDFIHHFYMREIGFETEQLFKLKLRNWLNMNMPYWVKMLETDELIKEPLVNVNYFRKLDTGKDINQTNKQTGKQKGQATDTSKGTNSNTSTGSGSSDSFTRNIESDTPDSRLQLTTNEDGSGVIEYASGISEAKNKNSAKNNESSSGEFDSRNTNNSTVDMENNLDVDTKEKGNEYEHFKGNMGMKTESEMIALYREILMRWEPMIFREMEQLFMLVY